MAVHASRCRRRPRSTRAPCRRLRHRARALRPDRRGSCRRRWVSRHLRPPVAHQGRAPGGWREGEARRGGDLRARDRALRAEPPVPATGMDWISFTVAAKGVLLEGLEVAFIVVTFGASAGMLGPAAVGAALAGALVLGIALIVHRPLARVPENGLKFAVGVMLVGFGTFWAGEGVGIDWPAGDAAILLGPCCTGMRHLSPPRAPTGWRCCSKPAGSSTEPGSRRAGRRCSAACRIRRRRGRRAHSRWGAAASADDGDDGAGARRRGAADRRSTMREKFPCRFTTLKIGCEIAEEMKKLSKPRDTLIDRHRHRDNKRRQV